MSEDLQEQLPNTYEIRSTDYPPLLAIYRNEELWRWVKSIDEGKKHIKTDQKSERLHREYLDKYPEPGMVLYRA